MADELTADQHYALAMDFRNEARISREFDGEQRMLARAQFHATMAVAARLAGSSQPLDAPAPMSRAEFRYEQQRLADRLRGPLPKNDPNGLITRVKELAKVVTEGIVDGQVTEAQAGYIAVALFNNGLLRRTGETDA